MLALPHQKVACPAMGRTPLGCRSSASSAGRAAALRVPVTRAIQPVCLEDRLEAGGAVRQVSGLQGPRSCAQTPVAHFQPQFHDPIETWEQTGIGLGAHPEPDRKCGPAVGRTPSTTRPSSPDLGPDLTWVTLSVARAPAPRGGSHAPAARLTCMSRQVWTVPGLDPAPDRGAAPKASTGQTARAA